MDCSKLTSKEIVSQLIDLTRDSSIEWESPIELLEYRTFLDEYSFVIKKVSSLQILLAIYENTGKESSLISMTDEDISLLLKQLFEIVVDNKSKKNVDRSISYHRFIQTLIRGRKDASMKEYQFSESNWFCIKQEKIAFVEPILSHQPTSLGYTVLDNAQVILVSAPGATGKSALCDHLSSQFRIPVIDLSAPVALGEYSIVGLLNDNLSEDDCYYFKKGLTSGENSVIIDAVDEGYARTGQVAFEGFLNDIVRLAKSSKSTSFIVFGRNSTLEFTSLYLEEQGLRVAMTQIEPFTQEKARLFIDNYADSDSSKKYNTDYQAVRDYIISEIGGFFKNESDLNHRLYERFIGYAPVLLSISTLLNSNKNYKLLLQELQGSRKKHIDLIIQIIEMVLLRDQRKIREQLTSLLNSYPEAFAKGILDSAYSTDEQCKRIFKAISGIDFLKPISEDEHFNLKYEESCEKWFEEHPFMISSTSIQNKIFESYVLVSLAQDRNNVQSVVDYIESYRGNSYLLFDLFSAKLGDDRFVDYRMIPALIESFKMMDRVDSRGCVEIEENESKTDSVVCSISFTRDDSCGSAERSFVFELPNNQSLEIPSSVSNLIVDAPITVSIKSKYSELGAPVMIRCNKIVFASQTLLISASGAQMVVLEAPVVEVVFSNQGTPTVSNPGATCFRIMTDSTLPHPYVQFKKPCAPRIDDKEITDLYHKMRRIILQFRAHKNDELGKYKDKIDNRIGRNSAVGKAVLNSLKEAGVIFTKERLYIIDTKKLNETLGLSYDDIMTFEINEKTRSFLAKIEHE